MAEDDATNLTIGIKVETQSLREANELVEKLVSSLNQLRGISQQAFAGASVAGAGKFTSEIAEAKGAIDKIVPGIHGLQKSLYELSEVNTHQLFALIESDVKGWATAFEAARKATGYTIDEFQDLWSIVKQGQGLGRIGTEQHTQALVDQAKVLGYVGDEAKAMAHGALGLETAFYLAFGRNVAGAHSLQDAMKAIGVNMNIAEPKAKSLFNVLSGLRTKMAGAGAFKIDIDTGKVRSVKDDLRELAAEEQEARIEAQALTNAHKLSASALSELSKATGIDPDTITSFSRLNEELQKIGRNASYMGNLRKMAQFANELPEPDFSNFADQLKIDPSILATTSALAGNLRDMAFAESQVEIVSKAMHSAHRLNNAEILSGLPGLNMSTSELQKHSRALEDAQRNYQMTTTYLRATKGAIGPLGYAFRDITMQIYWASLGFLFLTMTMTRAEKAAYTAKNSAYSLSKGYFALLEAQHAYQEAMQTYGTSSREAGEATVRLKQAQMELELQQQSLRVSIKSEILQGWQGYLSTIPLVVNTMWMFYSAMGALNGLMTTATEMKLKDAAAALYHGIMNKFGAQSTQEHATAAGADAGAIGAEAAAAAGAVVPIGVYTNAVNQASFATRMLVGAATLGIGLLASFGITMAMTALAEAETEKKMAEMNEQMRLQAQEWESLIYGAKGYNWEMAGGSVIPNVREATQLMRRMNSTMKNNAWGDSIKGAESYSKVMKKVESPDILSKAIESPEVSKDFTTIMPMTPLGFLGMNMVNHVTVNFPNLTIREEGDITKISESVTAMLTQTMLGSGVKM